MLDIEKEQVKRAVEKAVLPDDILFHKVLGYIAQKYGSKVVIDFVKQFDQVYPERREDKRRNYARSYLANNHPEGAHTPFLGP